MAALGNCKTAEMWQYFQLLRQTQRLSRSFRSYQQVNQIFIVDSLIDINSHNAMKQ